MWFYSKRNGMVRCWYPTFGIFATRSGKATALQTRVTQLEALLSSDGMSATSSPSKTPSRTGKRSGGGPVLLARHETLLHDSRMWLGDWHRRTLKAWTYPTRFFEQLGHGRALKRCISKKTRLPRRPTLRKLIQTVRNRREELRISKDDSCWILRCPVDSLPFVSHPWDKQTPLQRFIRSCQYRRLKERRIGFESMMAWNSYLFHSIIYLIGALLCNMHILSVVANAAPCGQRCPCPPMNDFQVKKSIKAVTSHRATFCNCSSQVKLGGFPTFKLLFSV